MKHEGALDAPARADDLAVVGGAVVRRPSAVCDDADLEATDGGRHPQTPDESGKRKH